MKKGIAIFLTFLMLFQVVPFIEPALVSAGSTTYDGNKTSVGDWETYKTTQHLDSTLPPSIKVNNGTATAWFNKELWEEKSLVVYGEALLASTKATDWKAGTQNPNGIPYYTKDGVQGEYRYHGWDRNGNTIPNEHFIDDATSSATLEDKKWVYHPWDAGSVAYDSFFKNIGSISDYNYFALRGDHIDSPKVAKWINESLKTTFTMKNSTNTDKNLVHYNNIDSAPTGYSSGQGTMFHQSLTSGKIWYQSFSVPKYNKDDTPLKADIPEIAVTNIAENGDVTLSVKVTGEILDDQIKGDSIKESIYYHRGDIKEWNFNLTNSLTGEKLTAKGYPQDQNKKGYAIINLKIPSSSYKGIMNEYGEFTINLTGTAIATYSTGETGQGIATKSKVVKGTIEEKLSTPPPDEQKPIVIDFDVNAPHVMLDVDKFNLQLIENDVSQAVDRYVLLDGRKLSEAEETKFLNGQYMFPRLMEDKVYSYSVIYIDTNGGVWHFSSHIIVYDSVPHAKVKVDGAHKANRKISVTADSSINVDYLESRSSIVISEFSVTTDDGAQLYFGTNTSGFKEFLRKTEGNINVHVKVSNEYGYRTYSHQIYISPDYEPDIISIVWNSVLTRNEALDILASGASLDEDTVTNVSYKILYDSNNDGDPETEVYSGTSWNGSTDYKPDKLGNYKIVFTATEEFGQATIPQHITEADKKTKTVERKFFVDNLIPMTKVYTDIEYNFPKLDVVFMTDQSLPRPENDYIREHNVDITNSFRANSMEANVDLWDLTTYQYSETAYAVRYTGENQPPVTTYYSNNGYTGTIYRYDVDNDPYQEDRGGYQTFSDSKTATGTRSGSATLKYDKDGKLISQTSTNTPSISYSSGGYTGTLYKTGYDLVSSTTDTNEDGSYTVKNKYIGYYEGTVTKTWKDWVPNWVWVDDYTGYYSGTAYKYEKQSYTPAYSTESNKYIIYMAKNSLNNLSDYNYVKNIARDSKVILIADSTIQAQFGAYDYFIPYTTDTNYLVNEVVKITKAENPITNELATLINEPVTINYTDLDPEIDPIIEKGFQYVHDPNYFDNPQGLEAGALTSYSDTGYTSTLKTSFTKPGKYTIYRRIKDAPIGFEYLGGYSNVSALEVVAHRKPIANATLDWDFDAVSGRYKTKWVDNSYDPDYQYSDPNKGIVDRKIKYKKGSGSWIYEIPDNLDPGTYSVEYIVMDKHGVWSDSWVMNFTLASVPGMQILDAKAKPADSQFTLAGVPASENLILYDVKTRYPYDTYLDIAIYQGGVKKTTSKTVYYTAGVTGTKVNNDIAWSNITYNVPSTLADGNYQIRVTAIGTGGQTTYKDIPFTVSTPINLVPTTSTSLENATSTSHDIKATTSKYVTSVQATMFKGTGYQQVITLTAGTIEGNIKNWSKPFIVSSSIPEGTYTIEYRATTTNGKVEIKSQQVTVVSLRITGHVNHTDEWNQNRISYNQAKTGTEDSPRTYDVFFPGENFILKAETTGDAQSVKVEILDTDYSTSLSKTSNGIWEGELWDSEMMSWKTKAITFRFTVTSATGIQKTYEVPIKIEDDAYWRQHGTF